VPCRRRNRRAILEPPPDVLDGRLSDDRLEKLRRREGALEFATLGSGNHFLELQADEEGRLWLMVHSGSRALGPAIRDHHLARAEANGDGLRAVDAESDAGAAYLGDAAWARRFAAASRRAIAREAGAVLESVLGAALLWESAIATDHNHVAREEVGGEALWIHRKGAMPAHRGEPGVLPGSMGTRSFHVEGRGCAAALCSSAHGAGRLLSRGAARGQLTVRELGRQMEGIWFDHRLAAVLLDEAPSAYKDIRAVLRGQKDLVKVTRTLRPMLAYKGV
jgi:tRNA-splicing ligase RtcB